MIDHKLRHDQTTAIIRLASDEGWDCLAVWLAEDVLVASDTHHVWARFNARSQHLMQQARAMPVERFVLVDRWLMREGGRVAVAELPELDWQPIKKVIQFQFPWIGEAGRLANVQSLTWQLTRGGIETPSAAAIIEWNTLVQWVDTAPQWRLDKLRYCISQQAGQCHALVLGTPVPPIQSQYLVAKQHVLIPAGMHWLPELEPSLVQQSFDVQSGQWLLWRATDDWCLIDDEMLVPLSRASVRTCAAGDASHHA